MENITIEQFNDTLTEMVKAAESGRKADKTTQAKATAHGPAALARIFGYGDIERLSVDGWIKAACIAAGVRSKSGKHVLQAFRQNGLNGLHNLANDLKWLDDNAEEYACIPVLMDAFMRHDPNGDVMRNYLISAKAMLPAEAKAETLEAVQAAYDAIEDAEGKELEEEAYWKAIEAPTTWGGFMAACRKAVKDAKPDSDKVGKAIATFTATVKDMSIEDIAARQDELLAAFAAIEAAVEMLSESDEAGDDQDFDIAA